MRVLYYNIMILKNIPVVALWPIGLLFAILTEKMTALKTKLSPAVAALLLCALALFVLPANSFAAGKNAAPLVEQSTATAALELAAKDADPGKRALAAARISYINDAGKATLLKALLADTDARVKAIAAKGLAKDGDTAAYAVLAEALDGADENARQHAIEGMGILKDGRAAKRLVALLDHENSDTRWKAVEALGGFRGANVVDALLLKAAEENEDGYIRESAVEALFKIGDKRAVAGLKALTSPKKPGLEKMARRAAALIESKK